MVNLGEWFEENGHVVLLGGLFLMGFFGLPRCSVRIVAGASEIDTLQLEERIQALEAREAEREQR